MVLNRFAAVFCILCAQLLAASAANAQEEPRAQLRGEMPPELREAVTRAIGESRQPPASRLEARRRAVDAATDVLAVLENLGYRDHIIEPGVSEDGRPVVNIVQIGRQFTIREPAIVWTAPEPPDPVQEAAFHAMGLKNGDVATNPGIVAAQGRIISALQRLGYADATGAPPVPIIDFEIYAVIPDFSITAGPLVRLDGLVIRTDGRTNPDWVRQLAPWEEGDLYDPEDVAELERRLLDAQVFDSVTVALAPVDQTVDGNRPVLVSLSERPRRLQEIGAGYSTSEGAGFDGRLTWYNRLGRADTLTLFGRLAEIEQRLEGELSLPHWRVAQRTLRLGGGVYQQLTDAYDELGAVARADITYRYSRTSYRTLGVSVDITETEERVPVVRDRQLASLAGLALIAWDRSNDPLNPTQGWRILASGEPTVSAGDGAAYYLRAQAQGTAYLPLDERGDTVIAGRLRIASVIGGELADIPASRRFYAGGGGSVRGYAYQGVGPRLPDNTPQGGLGLFEASLEARRRFTRRWGGVLFADVGGLASNSAPDFSNVSTGVGVGVRYDLGFGPIRADIAVPLTKRRGDPSYQIYLSIGQSF